MRDPADATKSRFVPLSEEIFTPCTNQPSNVFNIDRLFNLTTVEFKMNDELNIDFNGNSSLIWDIEKSDHIQVSKDIYIHNL